MNLFQLAARLEKCTLPGCFSAADCRMDEVIDNAKEDPALVSDDTKRINITLTKKQGRIDLHLLPT